MAVDIPGAKSMYPGQSVADVAPPTPITLSFMAFGLLDGKMFSRSSASKSIGIFFPTKRRTRSPTFNWMPSTETQDAGDAEEIQESAESDFATAFQDLAALSLLRLIN
jgi:hypothetical protein